MSHPQHHCVPSVPSWETLSDDHSIQTGVEIFGHATLCVGPHAGNIQSCTRHRCCLEAYYFSGRLHHLQFARDTVWSSTSWVLISFHLQWPLFAPGPDAWKFSFYGNWTQLLHCLAILIFLSYRHKLEASRDEGNRLQWLSKCQILPHSPCAPKGIKLITTFLKSWAWVDTPLKVASRNASCKLCSPCSCLQVFLLEPLLPKDSCLGPLARKLVIIN